MHLLACPCLQMVAAVRSLLVKVGSDPEHRTAAALVPLTTTITTTTHYQPCKIWRIIVSPHTGCCLLALASLHVQSYIVVTNKSLNTHF